MDIFPKIYNKNSHQSVTKMIPDKEFIDSLKAERLRPRTIEKYNSFLNHLKDYKRFTQTNVDLFISKYKSNIARSFLRKYKDFLLRNPKALGIKPDRINEIRAVYVSKMKKRKKKDIRLITSEELKMIHKAMPNEELKLMLLVSFFGALRVSELLNIKIKDFQWAKWERKQSKSGYLRIEGKGGKTNVIPIKDKTMIRIENWIKNNVEIRKLTRESYLFRVKERTWRNKLSKACVKAGLDPINPHGLRHSMAMFLRENDWELDEIKEFLRHESIATTQIYARATPQQITKKYDLL